MLGTIFQGWDQYKGETPDLERLQFQALSSPPKVKIGESAGGAG